jgi:hypothetical protein
MRKFFGAVIATGIASAFHPAAASVLTFDDLSGYGVAVPTSYDGFTFNSWFVDSTCSGAGFTGSTCNTYPYTPESPPTSIYTDGANSISRTTPFVFNGAYITGYSYNSAAFELFSGGSLVWVSATLNPSGTPTFLASGYSGLVDTVVVKMGSSAVMDNFTYNATAVPLPASAWLMLSGLVGVGVMARKRRGIAA